VTPNDDNGFVGIMSLRLAAACSAAVVLLACATAETATLPPTASFTDAPLLAKLSPEVGAFGFDVNGMDRSVAPGDDFVRYAVGKWIDTTEIPPDRSSLGSVAVIKEKAAARVRGIIEAAALKNTPEGSVTRKVGDYFTTFMDEAHIERLGVSPLKAELDTIAAINTRRDLSAALGESVRADVDVLNLSIYYTARIMGLWVAEDLNDATKYRPYLLQGGLGMPDREYYLGANPRYAELRTRYEAHASTMLRLAGFTEPEARAKRIMALEMSIAKAHVSVSETNDFAKGNTVWLRSELAAKAPGLNWTAFLTAAGINRQPRFGAWQPSAIAGISKLTASEPLQTWKDYLAFHSIENAAPFLSKAFADELFAFHGHAVSGTPEQPERWKRGVDNTSAALGDAIGRLYVAKYFPPEAKTQAEEMANNMLKAFAVRLDRLAWMGPETKVQAKRKLANFRVMVGYPDTWRDYSALQIIRGDAYGNWRRAGLFDYHRNVAKLGRPVDRREWFMTPQTVDALFAPCQNSVTLPAAILAPTFYDPGADTAVNYGALGAGLGHEVSHGFDDNGALFDAEGNLKNWWTKADMDHFRAESKKLADQYSKYEPLPGLHIDGRQTSMENIADLAGLATAWDAYQLSLRGHSSPTIDGFTAEQRFFLGFAQNYRAKLREAALRRQIVADVHAPAPYRTLTVRNLDAWYSTFDVKPGQKLYLAPAERVKIW
jgi:putative endopeptidase